MNSISPLHTALVLLIAFAPACSNGTDTLAETGKPSDGGDSLKWQPLLTGDWDLDPGSEGYRCIRRTLTEDVWVSAFRPISPLGTHHTVMGIADPGGPGAGAEGVSECTGGDVGAQILMGSGVGTEPMQFPDGVGVKIAAGKQLILNLHLFNSSGNPLSGTSGVEVVHADPSKIQNEAQIVLAGKTYGLQVPPGDSTQKGRCTMPEDVTVFTVLPHMHKLGTHLAGRLVPQHGEPTPLVDRDYSFDEQLFRPVAPSLSVARGDTIEVDCTYRNPGTTTVAFGQSTNDEMCFLGAFIYPAVYPAVTCDDTIGQPGNCGPDGAAPGLEVLASGLMTPALLTVDGTTVYWADSAGNGAGGSVSSVPIQGGSRKLLASGQPGAWGIAVDGTSAYWANFMDGTVMKGPLAGGETVALSTGQKGPNGIALDATSVYFTNYGDGSIAKVPAGGGETTVLATGQAQPDNLVVDATNVYWTNNGGTVMKVPLAGGTATEVATGQSTPQGIAIDAVNVYWINHGDASVMKAPLAGGAPVMLAKGSDALSDWSGLATDGTNVYWSSGGSIMKVPAAGGAATTLVSGQQHPIGLAADGTSVYWTTVCGSVIKFTPP